MTIAFLQSAFSARKLIATLTFAALTLSASAQSQQAFRNESLPVDERVKAMLKSLTLEEKASLLGYQSKAVDRLGIPAYNWWNEGLHGVARAGEATVFPQAIGMAATFNDALVRQIGTVISTEARAKYNMAQQSGRRIQYMGLTYWSPNINIFRDPRWGRGQETYGEDPLLTSRMGIAYVSGMQGTDPLHLKVAATAKHFVAHSGPEATRDEFNAVTDEKDLRDTYLQAFGALVKNNVASVMTAYNRVNGEPNSTSNSYLKNILLKEWGFKGYVVTDCGALDDIYLRHKTLPNSTAVAAAAIKAGINLDCSSILQTDVVKAVKQGLLTEKEVDKALAPALRTQLKLGFYDIPEHSPFYSYRADSISNAAHTSLARKAAQQSMVLLKNANHILPFANNKYSSITVLGTNAASLDALVGSYHGVSSKMVDFVAGITAAVSKDTRVEYDLGSNYTDTTHFGGIWAAGNSDVTVAVIGLSPVLEGEAGDAFLSATGGDKADLELPPANVAFIKALRKGNPKKPIVAVVTAGSAVNISAIEPYVDAVILAWYPGEQGGNALADILFGKVSPSGHLPVTFYRSVKDLPAYDNYQMKGRTYRYYNGAVQYPFGFGLSYTNFTYAWDSRPKDAYQMKDIIAISVNVTNAGQTDGDEVVQAYIKYPSGERMPVKELKAFKRLALSKGATQNTQLSIPVAELRKWDLKSHQWKLYPGTYQLQLGSHSADEKLSASFVVK